MHPTQSRPLTRRSRPGFRPGILKLEERTMMASGPAAAPVPGAGSTRGLAASIFLSEATTLLVGQPLPERLVARLTRGIQQGSLTREGALRQVLRTPHARAALVQDLTEDLLDRDPTPA